MIPNGHALSLDIIYHKFIKVVANPGRESGAVKIKRELTFVSSHQLPRSPNIQKTVPSELIKGLIYAMPVCVSNWFKPRYFIIILFQSQTEIKQDLLAIPSDDHDFFGRLQRTVERSVKAEINEYKLEKKKKRTEQ